MELNFVLVVAGLILCFGGLYIRKVCAGIMGLCWGAIGAFVVTLLTAGLFGLNDESLAAIVICAIMCCVVSACFDRFAIALNSFLSSAVIAAVILMMVASFDDFSQLLIVAVIIAGIVSAISYKMQDYSFVFITAFSGAFLASLGGYGIAEGRSISDVFGSILWYGADKLAPVLVGTVILGVIGCCVQWRRIGMIPTSPQIATNSENEIADTKTE